MKKCTRCKKRLSTQHFHKNKSKKDGYASECKECVHLYAEKYYKRTKNKNQKRCVLYYSRNKEHLRERGRYHSRQEKSLARVRCWHKNNRAAVNKIAAKWRSKNKHKRRAHSAVANAIKVGKLVKQRCAVCSAYNTQAHHVDYKDPLNVTWLCMKCHRKEHRQYA